MGSGIPGSRDPLGGHIVGHAEFMGQKYSRKMDPQPLYPLIVFQNLETEECTVLSIGEVNFQLKMTKWKPFFGSIEWYVRKSNPM